MRTVSMRKVAFPLVHYTGMYTLPLEAPAIDDLVVASNGTPIPLEHIDLIVVEAVDLPFPGDELDYWIVDSCVATELSPSGRRLAGLLAAREKPSTAKVVTVRDFVSAICEAHGLDLSVRVVVCPQGGSKLFGGQS